MTFLESIAPFIPHLLGRKPKMGKEAGEKPKPRPDEVAHGYMQLFLALARLPKGSGGLSFEEQRKIFTDAVEEHRIKTGAGAGIPLSPALAAAHTAFFRRELRERLESLALPEGWALSCSTSDEGLTRLALVQPQPPRPSAESAEEGLVLRCDGKEIALGVKTGDLLGLPSHTWSFSAALEGRSPRLFSILATDRAELEKRVRKHLEEYPLSRDAYDGMWLGTEAIKAKGGRTSILAGVPAALELDVSLNFFRWSVYVKDKFFRRPSSLGRPPERQFPCGTKVGDEFFGALQPLKLGLACKLEDKGKTVYALPFHPPTRGEVLSHSSYTFTCRSSFEIISLDDWMEASAERVASLQLYEETGIRSQKTDVTFLGCVLAERGRRPGSPQITHKSPLIFGTVEPVYLDMRGRSGCAKKRPLPIDIFRTVFSLRKNRTLLMDNAFDGDFSYIPEDKIPIFLQAAAEQDPSLYGEMAEPALRLLLALLHCRANPQSKIVSKTVESK